MEFSDDDLLFVCTNPHELHLIILPTEKCNFRCLYCYEDHVKGRMSDATVSAICQYLSRNTPELKHLTIDWFGGEPLLGLNVIRRINAHALSLAKDQKFWFRSGMTTNAYLLTPNVFDELTALGVNQFQITLDGPKDLHDTTRIQTNGQGSFDRIWSNLQYMKTSSAAFDVLLRVHLTRSNFSRIPELAELISAEFGGDPRFKIFLKPIKNLGGEGSAFAKQEAVFDGEAEARRLETELKIGSEFWQPNAICHASKFNSWIFRADGAVAKCTTALDDPINRLGTIRDDGTLDVDQDKILKWSRGVFSMNRDELYCPLGGIHKCGDCGSKTEEPALATA